MLGFIPRRPPPTPDRGAGCSRHHRRARCRGAASAQRRVSLAERQLALYGRRERHGVWHERPREHHIVPDHRRHTLVTRRARLRGVQRRVRPLSLANRRRYAPAAGVERSVRRAARRAGHGMDANDRSWAVRPLLTEVIITAERQEQNVQRSALAVSVVSGDEARDANVTRPQDLTNLVPGLMIGAINGSSALTYLRGVGNAAATSLQDPAVTFEFRRRVHRASDVHWRFVLRPRARRGARGSTGTLYAQQRNRRRDQRATAASATSRAGR